MLVILGLADSKPLTESTLSDLLRCHGKHPKYLCHYLNESVRHCRDQWNLLCINMKTSEEIPDTFEEIEEGVITCTDSNGGLVVIIP